MPLAHDCAAATDATATLFTLLSDSAAPDELESIQARVAANREATGAYLAAAVELGRAQNKFDADIRADGQAARLPYSNPGEAEDFSEFVRTVAQTAGSCAERREEIVGG
jgi:hypothetical protein